MCRTTAVLFGTGKQFGFYNGEATMKFQMNPNFEAELAEQIKNSPLQQELNSKLQGRIREVNSSMKGGDVNAIYEELERRLFEIGVTPNVPNLREVAAEIAAGTLTDVE